MIRQLVTTLGLRFSPAVAAEQVPEPAGFESVFAIDENPDSLGAIGRALDQDTYQLQTVPSAEAAKRKLGSFRPDIIFVAPDLLAADGTRIGRWLLAEESLIRTPVIALKPIRSSGAAEADGYDPYDGSIARPIEAEAVCERLDALRTPVQRKSAGKRPIDPLVARFGFDPEHQADLFLAAIEEGLPDSQYSGTVLSGLKQLAAAPGAERMNLSGCAEFAERFAMAATARARLRFRSMIRICRGIVNGDFPSESGMADLRTKYLARRFAELATLEAAFERGDYQAIGDTGHNLKGSGAAYGFAELTDIGRGLETAAKGCDADAVDNLLYHAQVYLSMAQSVFAEDFLAARAEAGVGSSERRGGLKATR